MDVIVSMRQYVDDQYRQSIAMFGMSEDFTDYKVKLSTELAIELFGGESRFAKLQHIFSSPVSQILLRRCSAHGKFIDFHTDHSRRTMQIALNGDDEYIGGRLVFVTREEQSVKFMIPNREAGIATIHNDTIIHGVTQLVKGVRYGLFFLYCSQN